MSALIPILPTPTPDAREAFMRAAHAAGFIWGDGDHKAEVRRARNDARFTHIYLYYARRKQYAFVESPEELIARSVFGTLVNSPAHWIAYALKHHIPK